MTNDIMVAGSVKKDQEENSAKEMVQLQADIREVSQLIESFKKLEDSFEWGQYMRILIEPAIQKERKTIEGLNKTIVTNPKAMEELIFHNAFLGVLETFTDIPKLRKKYIIESESLRGRLKKLEDKRNK